MKQIMFLLLLMVIVLMSTAHGQDNPNQLDSTETLTQDKFLRTLIDARKPGGIVWESNCSDNNFVETKSEPTAIQLRETLDAIIRENPRYRWTVDQGAFNLLPATGEPDFLKIWIKKLHIEDATNVTLALDQVLLLPNVKAKANQIQLNQGIQLGGLSSLKQRLRTELNLKDVSVRQALNLIASAHGNAVWKYSQSQCNGTSTSSLKFIVR